MVGEVASPFYTISSSTARVTFTVTNENIVQVNLENNTLTALNVGTTKVNITATEGLAVAKESFIVVVTPNGNYSLKINTLDDDCYIENDDCLVVGCDSCMISFDFYDYDGERIETPIVIETEEGVSSQSFCGGYIVTCEKEGVIEIIVKEYDFTFNLKVKRAE